MPNQTAQDEGPLTPAEAAGRLSVSTKTLGRWADSGLLPFITLPSGHRRYRRADVEAIERGDTPAPAEAVS